MSTLFKNSFQSKQLKQFTELVIKTIPSIKRDAVKSIYKTIKSGGNPDFDSIESAINCLERKLKLDLQIASYSNIINDKENNTFSEVQSAKSYVVKLTMNPDTSHLIDQIERAFNLSKGSLSHPQASNTHLIPSKSKRRSLSVTKNNGITDIEELTKTPPNHGRSTTLSRVSLNALNEGDNDASAKQMKEKQRSRSVMNLNTNLRARKSEEKSRILPMMNTKEYLQFLLEKAVTNKSWNDNDADRLCKCAITMKCDWITIHSMWVKKCYDLLNKYSRQKYKNDLKLHKKSMRRGSKIMVSSKEFKQIKNEKDIKSECKICVTIGYPLGQTSTVSKVAETTQSVSDGAHRVRLMVSAGKVIMEDWKYILCEVKSVVAAANGCDVRIVFPDTNQITEEIKHTFNQKIMQGMAAKSQNETHTKRKDAKQRKLPCTFSDDESEDEEGHRKKRKKRKKEKKKYMSESSDDESSVSVCSSIGDYTPLGNTKIVLSKSEEQMIVDKKINKKLLRVTGDNKNGKNSRRASTMTSIKYKKSKAKKKYKGNQYIKGRKSIMINQSTTDLMETGSGAITEKQKQSKKKKKKKKAVGKSVGALEELKKKTKKKKKKTVQKSKTVNTNKNGTKKRDKKKKKMEEKKGKNNSKVKDKKSGKKNNKLNRDAKRRAKSVGKIK